MAIHTAVVVRTPRVKAGSNSAPAACVISGGSAEELACSISERLGAKMIKAEVRVFADGESKLRLAGGIAGARSAIVVQSLHPPVDTNLLRALCLISWAREEVRAGGGTITAVIPYMGYARQDAEFLPGEIATMRVVGSLLRGAGASRIVTVDMHSERGLEMLGPGAANVTAVPALARHFGSMRLRDPVVVSPDKGGAKRAERFASGMGCGLVVLEKSRDRKTGAVRIKTRRAAAVRDRDVILVDDMISTGGSLVKAAEFLRDQRCGRVYAACTHALLVDGARARLRRAGVTRIVSANTIPNRSGAAVDVSEEIAHVLLP